MGFIVFYFYYPALSLVQLIHLIITLAMPAKIATPANEQFLPKKTIAATAPLLKNYFRANGKRKSGIKKWRYF